MGRGEKEPLDFERIDEESMHDRSRAFLEEMAERRSVRRFSDEPIPVEVVRRAIHTAGQAPSGANKQPWTFALVTDAGLKSDIRRAAEQEERKFYEERATEEWLEDLEPLDTGPEKPFLEDAPALIVVFAQAKGPEGGRHYYVKESVGLACGFLLAALHRAGLGTLTHTPSPMGFLAEVLDRPDHERPFLLIPVGYPAEDCEVPAIDRKERSEILVEY
ncbi:MAG: nitroreductase family protein [Bradymonadaceae bacterium]